MELWNAFFKLPQAAWPHILTAGGKNNFSFLISEYKCPVQEGKNMASQFYFKGLH